MIAINNNLVSEKSSGIPFRVDPPPSTQRSSTFSPISLGGVGLCAWYYIAGCLRNIVAVRRHSYTLARARNAGRVYPVFAEEARGSYIPFRIGLHLILPYTRHRHRRARRKKCRTTLTAVVCSAACDDIPSSSAQPAAAAAAATAVRHRERCSPSSNCPATAPTSPAATATDGISHGRRRLCAAAV